MDLYQYYHLQHDEDLLVSLAPSSATNFFTIATNPIGRRVPVNASSCSCQAFLASDAASFDGHVVISVLDLLPPKLQYLFTLGMLHRPSSLDLDTTLMS